MCACVCAYMRVCVRTCVYGVYVQVCMCSSAQFPDYPTAESFAEAASSKAPEAVHYYGNCNSKNSKSYSEVPNP